MFYPKVHMIRKRTSKLHIMLIRVFYKTYRFWNKFYNCVIQCIAWYYILIWDNMAINPFYNEGRQGSKFSFWKQIILITKTQVHIYSGQYLDIYRTKSRSRVLGCSCYRSLPGSNLDVVLGSLNWFIQVHLYRMTSVLRSPELWHLIDIVKRYGVMVK